MEYDSMMKFITFEAVISEFLNMKYTITILIFVLCLFVSCYDRVSNTDLTIASQLVEAPPDSAMTILYQIDTLNLTSKQKADRRILLPQSYNLCGHAISND